MDLRTAPSTNSPHLTDKELVALLESATTSADHERLAAYYDQQAVELEAKAAKDTRTAAAYRRPAPSPKIQTFPWAADHYDVIAQAAQKAALEARTMAEYHRLLAKSPSGFTGRFGLS